jgi:hypothetical protein
LLIPITKTEVLLLGNQILQAICGVAFLEYMMAADPNMKTVDTSPEMVGDLATISVLNCGRPIDGA